MYHKFVVLTKKEITELYLTSKKNNDNIVLVSIPGELGWKHLIMGQTDFLKIRNDTDMHEHMQNITDIKSW